MTFPKLKDLFDGQKLQEVPSDKLEDVLNDLNTSKYDPAEVNEKVNTQKNHRKYRIKQELKERKESLNCEPEPEPEPAPEEETERDYLLNKLNKLTALLNEPEYANDDFNDNDIEAMKQLIAEKTAKLLNKNEMYLPLMTNMFYTSCNLLEAGSNKLLTNYMGQDALMMGYTNSMVTWKEQVQDCLREIFKEKPEVLSYLKPEIRLSLIMLLTAGNTIVSNVSNSSNFRDDKNIYRDSKMDDAEQKPEENDSKKNNNNFISNIISNLSTRANDNFDANPDDTDDIEKDENKDN